MRTGLFCFSAITKTLTATLLATMVLDGSVKLGDAVSNYLPKSVRVPARDGKPITLLNLATQHSGLPRMPSNILGSADPYSRYSVGDMYAFLSSYRLQRDPGAAFVYSNYGVALLGQALANREHTTYAALLRKRVLVPLGMRETGLAMAPASYPHLTVGHTVDNLADPPWTFRSIAPAGAVFSSMADMLKYARCNLGRGPLAAACLFAQHPRSDFLEHKIGLVWWTDDDSGIVHHGGDTSGYHASVAIAPTHTEATVALTNGGLSDEDLALHVLDASVPVQSAPAVTAIDPALIDGYLGTYVAQEDRDVDFVVTRAGDALMVKLGHQPVSRIYPDGPDRFASHVVQASFKFLRGADGKTTALILLQNGATHVFARPDAAVAPDAAGAMYPPVATLDAATLQSYVGTYTSSIGLFTIAFAGEQLTLRLEGQSAVPLYPSAKDEFFTKLVTTSETFGRDTAGNVTGFTLRQGGAVVVATKK